jgi:tyrosine-protein phosphatase SIW14
MRTILCFQLGLEGNKEPFRSMPPETAVPALRTVMDAAHHPLLIHCNEGKHRTGSLVGMLRRARGWALSSTVDEYMMFAGSKARIVDQR